MHALLPTNAKAQSLTNEGDHHQYLKSAPAKMATAPSPIGMCANVAQRFVILLIESDMTFVAAFTKAVSEYGFDVEHQVSLSNIKQALLMTRARMVAIGSVSRGPDNFSTCRDIRQINRGIPIIWLQSGDDEFDQALMIELGADVCISRSSNIRVMLAQVKSLRRRLENDSTPDLDAGAQRQVITHGRLQVSPASFQLYVDGKPIALTTGLFTTLMCLVNHANEVIPRKDLVQADQSAFSRAVDTQVNRLRGCLRRAGLPLDVIRSARGRGYMFVSNLCNLET